jgi:hypothetical protein
MLVETHLHDAKMKAFALLDLICQRPTKKPLAHVAHGANDDHSLCLQQLIHLIQIILTLVKLGAGRRYREQ